MTHVRDFDGAEATANCRFDKQSREVTEESYEGVEEFFMRTIGSRVSSCRVENDMFHKTP